MSAIAQVKDGQILESVSRLQKDTKATNSSLDKDAFLQLLVYNVNVDTERGL